MANYAVLPVAVLIVLSVPILTLFIIAPLIRASRASKVKLEPYECGIAPTSLAFDHRFSVYFLIAVCSSSSTWKRCSSFLGDPVQTARVVRSCRMAIFLAILLIGYFYAWKRSPFMGLSRIASNRTFSPRPSTNSSTGLANLALADAVRFGVCAIRCKLLDPRHDMARFGAGCSRDAAQADLMIVSGTVTERWRRSSAACGTRCEPLAIAMNSCATAVRTAYASRGRNRLIPVDVYIPGCPPRRGAIWG
jgi:NADH:ubiquinone oxidoreductase subunit 3 (subunit A)/Ni,Fe-hydrogenase III small subunit